jgi:hypothetical protein
MQAMSNCVRNTQGNKIKKIESEQIISPIEWPILMDLCADFRLLIAELVDWVGRICEIPVDVSGFDLIVAGGSLASGMTLIPRARFRSSLSAASSFNSKELFGISEAFRS